MRARGTAGAIAVAVLGAGCLVHVDRVADPAGAFGDERVLIWLR